LLPVQRLAARANRRWGYRFTPCADADVRIEPSGLAVNGISYGTVGPGDDILVDHGKVSVHRRGTAP
jgi:hypothetical protein